MPSQERINEFKNARFGLFIHWGIYSLLGAGEWVMYQRRIPVKEYEKLASQFNPTDFDAEKIVLTAKRAGMRYIVITAKHHDGFSMFSTKVSDFNIVDATPFKRDVMTELAEACRKHGLKLGFYYSHVREWRHPLAQSFECCGRPDKIGNYGNFWDYPNENKKDLAKYIDEFDIPQIKELLSQYGDIFTIWFDTPSFIQPKQAEKIRDAVHKVQPDCLVNGRVSDEIEADYDTMGDCEIPACGTDKPWDTPMTMAHGSWGYKSEDTTRPAKDFIRELCDVASKGGNFLLNVGPDAKGVIPEEYVKELEKIGDWLAVNGDAIYGTEPVGLCYRPIWGCLTRNGNKMYAMVFDENAKKIRLTGLKNKVISCKILGEATKFTQINEGDLSVLTIQLKKSAECVRVVTIVCDGNIEVSQNIIPGDDGSIQLRSTNAIIDIQSDSSKLHLHKGITNGWFETSDTLHWDFMTSKDNSRYRLRLLLNSTDYGHKIDLIMDGKTYHTTLKKCIIKKRGNQKYIDIKNIKIQKAGHHSVVLQPTKIICDKLAGLQILGIELSPKWQLHKIF